jgi:hypothetical protein
VIAFHTQGGVLTPPVLARQHVALLEITKLAPSLLHRYRLRFTPRGPSSPHKLPGRSVDGKWDDAEPWHAESQCAFLARRVCDLG